MVDSRLIRGHVKNNKDLEESMYARHELIDD